MISGGRALSESCGPKDKYGSPVWWLGTCEPGSFTHRTLGDGCRLRVFKTCLIRVLKRFKLPSTRGKGKERLTGDEGYESVLRGNYNFHCQDISSPVHTPNTNQSRGSAQKKPQGSTEFA